MKNLLYCTMYGVTYMVHQFHLASMGYKKDEKKSLSESEAKRIKAVAVRIKKLRKEKGHTSYENFAFDTNIPRMMAYRMEKGAADFQFTTLCKVLDALDVSLADFFDGFNQ
ncbi:MAG: helix-turn-helix transcriptional regulator [Bacteroidota bacterium]